MMTTITDVIISYYDSIEIENHRLRSWNHCFSAFSNIQEGDTKNLSLHLAFYLASWGMYRGSSELLQKDYLVHVGTVDILKKHQALRVINFKAETTLDDIAAILNLTKSLGKYYKDLGISPTDTLISKIILGTLGCLPAYDRFYRDGAKEHNVIAYKINESSIQSIFDFIRINKEELLTNQSRLLKDSDTFYPMMKLVDMYFWQIGFMAEEKRKELRKNNNSK